MTTQTAIESTARYMALWTTDELRNMRANTASDNLRDGFTREIERREVTSVPAPRTAEDGAKRAARFPVPCTFLVDVTVCSYDGEPVADMTEHAIYCGECFAYHVQEN